MIDTIAKRRLTHDGKTYQKGDTVPMPLQQFEADLGPNGLDWVERAPPPKTKPKKSKSDDTD